MQLKTLKVTLYHVYHRHCVHIDHKYLLLLTEAEYYPRKHIFA